MAREQYQCYPIQDGLSVLVVTLRTLSGFTAIMLKSVSEGRDVALRVLVVRDTVPPTLLHRSGTDAEDVL